MTFPAQNEACAAAECSEPTPWDMACLVFDDENDRAYCSTACAGDALDAREQAPETITLHDPQYAVDRDDLPDVSADTPTIARPVSGIRDANVALAEFADMFPRDFRPTADPDMRGHE